MRSARLEQTFRDRVITGLALKMDSAFRALLDDARAERGEAMHHLKTMAELFIYFHVVASDQTEATARRLIAKAAHEKLTYFGDNPAAATPEEIRDWHEWRDELLGSERRLPSLEQLARQHSAELGGWYARVYRLACEPAHIGDVLEFMPGPGSDIATGQPPAGRSRASIAAYYGLRIMVATLRAISETSDVPLPIDAADWDRRIDAAAAAEASH